jgi:hypothetical protein
LSEQQSTTIDLELDCGYQDKIRNRLLSWNSLKNRGELSIAPDGSGALLSYPALVVSGPGGGGVFVYERWLNRVAPHLRAANWPGESTHCYFCGVGVASFDCTIECYVQHETVSMEYTKTRWQFEAAAIFLPRCPQCNEYMTLSEEVERLRSWARPPGKFGVYANRALLASLPITAITAYVTWPTVGGSVPLIFNVAFLLSSLFASGGDREARQDAATKLEEMKKAGTLDILSRPAPSHTSDDHPMVKQWLLSHGKGARAITLT